MSSIKSDSQKFQHDRFIETARALGFDEDEPTFDEKLKVIARHKPRGETEAKPHARHLRTA